MLTGAAVTGPLSTRATRAAPTMAGATQTHVGTIAAMAPAGPRHRRHHLRQSRRRRSGSLRRSRRRHRRRQSCAPPRIPPRPRSLCGSLGPETSPLPSSPQPSDAPFQGLTPEGEEDSNWWDEFVAFAGLYDSPLTDPARTPDQAEGPKHTHRALCTLTPRRAASQANMPLAVSIATVVLLCPCLWCVLCCLICLVRKPIDPPQETAPLAPSQKEAPKEDVRPPPLTDPACFLVETPASPPTAECPPCPTTVPRPQPSWAARWWRTRAALARARRNSPTSSPPLSTEAHPISFWIFFHARRGIGEGGRLGALSPPLASNASARSRRPCQTVARPSNLARQG